LTDSPEVSILLVEDSSSTAELYKEYLAPLGHEVAVAETGKEAMVWLDKSTPDAVILDLKLPDMDGREILARMTADMPSIPVIVMTAHGSLNTAVEAMKAGARDFIVKPLAAERLRVTLGNALEHQRLRQVVKTYEQTMDRTTYCGFIGSSMPMQAVYKTIDAAAASRASVFVTGESGTGKEVCAEAIHKQSKRANGPLIAINCAAIPKELLESEIFGHVKGAFTGAVSNRVGAAEKADGGTLFLDEICELAPELQSKLLRFLQTASFQPVGSEKLKTVDVRFVCATNREPLAEIRAGRFREDLYYRLHVIPIELPPLKTRGDDIIDLSLHFLQQYADEESKTIEGLTDVARAALKSHTWRGNVRELQNVIRHAVVMADGPEIGSAQLPMLFDTPETTPPTLTTNTSASHLGAEDENGLPQSLAKQSTSRTAIQPLWITERAAIEEAVAACGGNIPQAAGRLEVSPSTLYRKRLAWTNDTA